MLLRNRYPKQDDSEDKLGFAYGSPKFHPTCDDGRYTGNPYSAYFTHLNLRVSLNTLLSEVMAPKP